MTIRSSVVDDHLIWAVIAWRTDHNAITGTEVYVSKLTTQVHAYEVATGLKLAGYHTRVEKMVPVGDVR